MDAEIGYTEIGGKRFPVMGKGKLNPPSVNNKVKRLFQIEGGETLGGAADRSNVSFSFRFASPSLITAIYHKAFVNKAGITGYSFLDCETEILGIGLSPAPIVTNSITGITFTSTEINYLFPAQGQPIATSYFVQGNQLITFDCFAYASPGALFAINDSVTQYILIEYES